MKISRVIGTTGEILQIFIRDSSSATGAGLTGLTNASSGLVAYYCRNNQATATAISLVSMTLGTYTSGGFKEIDATNMPGWYQFCPPSGVFTSGGSAAMHLKGATNMAPLPIEVELTAWNNQDATAGGISRIDAAISSRMATYSQPTGFLAATFPTGTIANTNNISAGTITTVANLTNAPTNGDFTAAMKISLNAATPASVVGAVGSVTGNVGGNVIGSVASVTGNVGGNVIGSVGSIATGGITAASIAASAFNGKGDWNIGKTGYALSATGVQAIWDALTSALIINGSIGKLLVDNINATISSRLASAGYTVPPTASTIAGAVWDEALASHLASGSTGAALNAAGSAGDPWSTALPGAYGSGTAGNIVGNVNTQLTNIAIAVDDATVTGFANGG